MRKLFLLGLSTFAAVMLGGAAQAADMPVKAPPPAAPVMYNWTGFYIGAHIGGAWADANGHDRFDGVNHCIWAAGVCFNDNGFGHNDGRFIAGGQVGYNYQVGQYVWGIEGQISAITHHNDDGACGSFTFTPVGIAPVVVHDSLFRCRDRGDWIATLAARLGVAFGQTGNWLFYIKGGAAFADGRFGIRLRDDCPWAFCNSNFVFNNDNNTRTGWMIGAGLETGWFGNWSWKLEYNFMDFGHKDIHIDNCLTTLCGVGSHLIHDIDFDRQISVVKFGLNYRFAPVAAPVAARY